MSVLFEAKVRYGPIYGLQLQIINMDPAFTLGVLAMEKQKAIEQLKSEGIFTRNKEVEFPLLPKSLAIISAETGKGFSDFISIINAYTSKYRILYKLFPAALQGDSAVSSITHQLHAISHNIQNYDAVLIIRGGGDELDLNCYNNFRLAKEVALFPIPVITGIGHSTNDTVVEMVAHHSNITPTDVAYFILGHFASFENRIVEAQSRLSFITEKLLINENQQISQLVRAVKSGSMPYIRQHASVLNSYMIAISKNAPRLLAGNFQHLSAFVMKLNAVKKMQLTQANAQLKMYDEKITILNPENVLKRGYSLTTFKGKLIRDVKMLKNDDVISTKLASGTIKSKVENIIKKKNGQ
jgi:exodeoxyribonuclease VII large subunit